MAFKLINILRKINLAHGREGRLEELKGMASPSDEFVIGGFTSELNLAEDSNPSFYKMPWLANLRFFILQILVATLQLLNRTQSLVVFFANLGYFGYFLYAVLSTNVYNSGLMAAKAVTQEISLMIFVGTIIIFSLSEGSSFESSIFYQILEILAIMAIIGACGAEFILFITEVISDFSEVCRKKKKTKKSN